MISSLAVMGLGYVGLPLALEACRSGITVVGVDIDRTVVDGLLSGHSHVDDIDSAAVAEMLVAGFAPSPGLGHSEKMDVFVICVPTPLDENGTPDLQAVRGATREVALSLRPGSLVVLESTTYPGTTEDTVRPLLEAGIAQSAKDRCWSDTRLH